MTAFASPDAPSCTWDACSGSGSREDGSWRRLVRVLPAVVLLDRADAGIDTRLQGLRPLAKSLGERGIAVAFHITGGQSLDGVTRPHQVGKTSASGRAFGNLREKFQMRVGVASRADGVVV